MNVANAVVPESGLALSRSAASAAGGLKNGNGKVRNTSKLSSKTRSSSPSYNTSPPPLKKCKRLGCTTCGRPPVTETFVFSSHAAAAPERRGNPVGKTVSKRADASAVAMPIQHEGIVDNLEELKDVEARCMPSECFGRHVREETWQHKTSQKVSQWLEDSCQSSVTGIVLPAGSSVCSELEAREMITPADAGQDDVESYTLPSSHLKPERVADASLYTKNPADPRLSGRAFVMAVEVKSSSSGWATTTICGIRYSIRCLKLVVCLPIVLFGLYLKIRPSSWELYEPPPT